MIVKERSRTFRQRLGRNRTLDALITHLGRDNLAGTQFHPEKSQATGLRLIGNFLRWKP